MYPKELITSLENELVAAGFTPLKTAEAVNTHFSHSQGTTLLFVNSLCGCAGPDARMGIHQAVSQATNHRPTHLVTIFPGVDEEAATAALQQYLKPYPLTSPCIALFKGSEVVYYMERYQIKGTPAEEIAQTFTNLLKNHC